MLRVAPTSPEAARVAPDPAPPTEAQQRALVRENLRFVWRALWSMGVPREDIDDAVQQVFLVATRKAAQIDDGGQRSFLFGVAANVAKETHRARQRNVQRFENDDGDEHASAEPGADALLDRKRARELLDDAMDSIPPDQRIVFALYEIEGMTMKEIAAALELPPGTVASRLRLAREQFQRAARRLRAKRSQP